MRVMVIGAGYWGQKLLRVLEEEGHAITQVVSLPQDGCKAIENRYDDPDAVVIATPAPVHYEQALTALRCDLDVFIEKPMTLSHVTADFLAAEADSRDCVVAVDSTYVHAPCAHAIREVLERHPASHINYRSIRISQGPKGVPIPASWDLIVHDLALLDAWGLLPVIQNGEPYVMTLETAGAQLRLNRGVATLISSRQGRNRARLIELDVHDAGVTIRWDDTGLWETPLNGGDRRRLPHLRDEPLKNSIREFADRCLDRNPDGITNARHGARVVGWVEHLFGAAP